MNLMLVSCGGGARLDLGLEVQSQIQSDNGGQGTFAITGQSISDEIESSKIQYEWSIDFIDGADSMSEDCKIDFTMADRTIYPLSNASPLLGWATAPR